MSTFPAASSRPDGVALIADIVGSRRLPDRAAAQEAILDAFARAHTAVPPLLPAWATVGDEFQALYARWEDAARVTLRVALTLPDGVLLRYGLGEGSHAEVAPGTDGGPGIQDGSAWHRAREAVQEAERRAHGLSTAYLGPDAGLARAVDGQLRLRDHVLRRLRARERRLAAHLLEGRTQAEAATAERITQSAVSQALARSGAAELLAVEAALATGADG